MLRLITNNDDRSFLIERAHRELASRRKRAEKFGHLLFSDPSWDLLLTLYINDDALSPAELTQAIDFAAASGATVRRWLQSLVARGLAVSASGHDEIGEGSVRLSEAAKDQMDAYFEGT